MSKHALPLLWLLALPSIAFASPSYPPTLQDELALACEPSCLVCHTRSEGGFGTANTPLGFTLRKARLECCDEDQLVAITRMLEASGTDSDSDGVSDIEELRAATDPNSSEGALECAAPKKSDGCQLGRGGSTFGPGLLVLLAAMLFRRAKRARHHDVLSYVV